MWSDSRPIEGAIGQKQTGVKTHITHTKGQQQEHLNALQNRLDSLLWILTEKKIQYAQNSSDNWTSIEINK